MGSVLLVSSCALTCRRAGRGQGHEMDGRHRRRASGRLEDGGRQGRSRPRPATSPSASRCPANYAVPPHHHPGDEVVRVVSAGPLSYGMGDKLDHGQRGQLRRAITSPWPRA